MQDLNQQRPEPARHDAGDFLSVHSMFYTLQGEGPNSGLPAVFLRLAGCNLQCPGCDTEYTQGRKNWMRNDLVNAIADMMLTCANNTILVITGGEPFRQNIVPFVTDFFNLTNRHIQVETNGVICPDGVGELCDLGMLEIVCSPKTSVIHPEIAHYAHAYKYVLRDGQILPEDGLPSAALFHTARPFVARPPEDWVMRNRGGNNIYITPIDEKDPERNALNVQACVRSALEFGYRADKQAHKDWLLP